MQSVRKGQLERNVWNTMWTETKTDGATCGTVNYSGGILRIPNEDCSWGELRANFLTSFWHYVFASALPANMIFKSFSIVLLQSIHWRLIGQVHLSGHGVKWTTLQTLQYKQEKVT